MKMRMKDRLFTIEGRPTPFYINCKRQRKLKANICNSCPFKLDIERFENHLID